MNAFVSIRQRLSDGPCWTRSFQGVKPALDRMIADGEVIRCKPPGGRGMNMVCLATRNRSGLLPIDEFAELLSLDFSLSAIATKMGISLYSANCLLKSLRAKYGWQAA